MKLKNDFYSVTEAQHSESSVKYTVHLNADHFIYAAHFPGNPITPGVCITQIVKELTEDLLQKSLFLKIVKNIKFTQVINPLQHSEIDFVIRCQMSDIRQSDCRNSDIEHKVSASVESGSVTFAKLSLIFVQIK